METKPVISSFQKAMNLISIVAAVLLLVMFVYHSCLYIQSMYFNNGGGGSLDESLSSAIVEATIIIAVTFVYIKGQKDPDNTDGLRPGSETGTGAGAPED